MDRQFLPNSSRFCRKTGSRSAESFRLLTGILQSMNQPLPGHLFTRIGTFSGPRIHLDLEFLTMECQYYGLPDCRPWLSTRQRELFLNQRALAAG